MGVSGNRLSIRAASCPVCGSRELHTDAVEHGGWLLLAECPRCDHRFTQPYGAISAHAVVKVAARVRPEVANAA